LGRLFQNSPSILFDLLENLPDNASDYRFDSVAVKEPTFEIDGVFLPPDSDRNGVIYFCEVQFQKKNSTPIPTALSSIAIKSIEFI
jgi:predicted transposase YdaD